MRRYAIEYKDSCDPGCPVFTWTCRAHNPQHAEQKFFDSEDSEGWAIVKGPTALKTD